jgi:hypothetical protein
METAQLLTGAEVEGEGDGVGERHGVVGPAPRDVEDLALAQDDLGGGGPAPRVRCVSMLLLDKNRRYIGKSQSKRPPTRTQRPPHRPKAGKALGSGGASPSRSAHSLSALSM